jgi:peroxiredoxin
MSQAEIAGGTVTPPNEFPCKGRRLRDFALPLPDGREIQLSDYRGRSNLVLILLNDGSRTGDLLSELASQYAKFRNEDAEVLAIAWLSPNQGADVQKQMNLAYPILADENGLLHRELGAIDAHSRTCAALYITDRFAEVFAAFRTRDGQNLPTTEEILKWLEFINHQCPECEPPEWPA